MDILIIAFTLAIVVCAICLIAVVLMQSSKSSGLGETFGGSTQTYDNALRDGGVVTTVLKCADSDVYNEGVEFFNNEPIYKQIVEMGSHVPTIEQSDYHYSSRSLLAAAVVNINNGAKIEDELQAAEDQLRFEMGL